MIDMSLKRVRKLDLHQHFWKTDGRLFYADPGDVQDAIEKSGQSEGDIEVRLGSSRVYLRALLQGGKISGRSAELIEWGLTPNELRLNAVLGRSP